MNTKELFRIAYKKLKSNVFFDKTQLPLRDKIVMFEKENFEEVLDRLANEIDNGFSLAENEFGEMTSQILNNIDCYVLPKKLLQNDLSNEERVYSNLPKDSVKVDECQYFIDMDVLGHVLGIAWILLVGYAIDEEGYEYSYGNRLKKDLIHNGKPDYSPYMFEPYFSQYETWRDKGLEQAKRLLSSNKSVVMLTLDFSRFYYSVDIDYDKLNRKVSQICVNNRIDGNFLQIVWHLTDFIYKVIENYSNKVRSFEKELVGNRNILPIGFAPSNIISNCCLKGFDDAIIKGWNPTYYGRYVDDVLIIDKVEKNSPIYEAVLNQDISTKFALDYYLINSDVWRKQDDTCLGNKERGLLYVGDTKKDEEKIEGKAENKDIVYYVNNDFLDFKGCEIYLQ